MLMIMIAKTIHLVFLSYTILLFIRIIGSWIPSLAQHTFMRFVVHYTNPYLNLFRKLIPPLGGMLDLSPLLAFMVLRFLEKFILSLIR